MVIETESDAVVESAQDKADSAGSHRPAARITAGRRKRGGSPSTGKRTPKSAPLDRESTVSAVCQLLQQGVPLTQACGRVGVWYTTVMCWGREEPPVAKRIAEAREAGYEVIAERMRNTARGLSDYAGGDSTGDVQRDKLIIETDFKLLSKWSSRYSDKVLLGEHPEHPFGAWTDEQVEMRYRMLLEKHGVTPSDSLTDTGPSDG